MGRMFLSILITLFIISSIGYGGYLFYENKNLNEIIKIKEKTIKDLSYENEKLKYKLNQQKDLVNHYAKTNKELAKEIRNLRYETRNNNRYKNHQIKIKPQSAYKNNRRYTTNNKTKRTTAPKKIYHKRYHKYNGYQKLVSDSKIKQRSDGRFVSNSAIYGIYKYRIFSAQCGGNPKIYGVTNECKTYAAYSTDPIYFAKSNLKELQTFDQHTHKIECHYDQKNGIMENCRAKIFSYKF